MVATQDNYEDRLATFNNSSVGNIEKMDFALDKSQNISIIIERSVNIIQRRDSCDRP